MGCAAGCLQHAELLANKLALISSQSRTLSFIKIVKVNSEMSWWSSTYEFKRAMKQTREQPSLLAGNWRRVVWWKATADSVLLYSEYSLGELTKLISFKTGESEGASAAHRRSSLCQDEEVMILSNTCRLGIPSTVAFINNLKTSSLWVRSNGLTKWESIQVLFSCVKSKLWQGFKKILLTTVLCKFFNFLLILQSFWPW